MPLSSEALSSSPEQNRHQDSSHQYQEDMQKIQRIFQDTRDINKRLAEARRQQLTHEDEDSEDLEEPRFGQAEDRKDRIQQIQQVYRQQIEEISSDDESRKNSHREYPR